MKFVITTLGYENGRDEMPKFPHFFADKITIDAETKECVIDIESIEELHTIILMLEDETGSDDGIIIDKHESNPALCVITIFDDFVN